MTIVLSKLLGGFIGAWLLGMGLGYAFRMISNIYDALFNERE
jgi:hypothetical protein